MSKSGSSTLLDFVDVDDLLDSLAEDDQIDVALAAAAAAEMPSFGEAEKEQSPPPLKGEREPEATGPSSDETHQQEEKQDEAVKGAEVEHEEKAASPGRQHVTVDVDATPLDKQLGLERFRALEKQRAEQKEQMRLEEKEVEKVKAAYAGKKWVIKQPAGPLRPQEAGELAVACAIKSGGKKSPREEIEELTLQEKEKKKEQDKAAAAAAHPPLCSPVKLPLPMINKMVIPEGGNAAGEDEDGDVKNKDTEEEVNSQADKEEGDVKGGEEHAEEKVEDDEHGEEKTRETEIVDGHGGGHEEKSSFTAQSKATPSPVIQAKIEDEAHAGGKNTEFRLKLKEKVPIFTCFSRRGNVREPHKPRMNKHMNSEAPASTGSTGELVEPLKEERKGEDDKQTGENDERKREKEHNQEEDEHKGEKDEHKGEEDEHDRENDEHKGEKDELTGEKDTTKMEPPNTGSIFED